MQPIQECLRTVTLVLESGATVYAAVYQGQGRQTSRRIILRDMYGAILHDTQDCYDMGNALYSAVDYMQSKGLREAQRDSDRRADHAKRIDKPASQHQGASARSDANDSRQTAAANQQPTADAKPEQESAVQPDVR